MEISLKNWYVDIKVTVAITRALKGSFFGSNLWFDVNQLLPWFSHVGQEINDSFHNS